MRRRWLVGLPLLLAAAAPLGALNKYVAVGDSITAGSSWPASCKICPVVFDCTGGCAASGAGRESCGHARRLQSWLGAGNDVINEGIGGEDTAGALSLFTSGKLDPHCGSPGDCIAVILMHGTNDMGGSISPESARDNLSAMIDIAKGRKIDVLLMSIVRRVYDPTNSKWASYRDLTQALAGAKNLQFVDPWTPLCPNTACYDANYWVPASQCTSTGDTSLGHLDSDGYDVLTDSIKPAFPASVPAAPSATSPMGNVTDSTPDFVWPSVATARWYQLEVDASTTWWEGAAICSGGTCTANPAVTLAQGPHSWRVRGRNLRGLGAYSATKSFDVVPVPPPAPTPTGPTGVLFESAPRYEWQAAPGATEYDLEVRDSGNNLDAQATALAASSVCSGGSCSYTEGTVLAPDDYTLKVRGRNAGGEGPLSSGLDFTIIACADDTPMNLGDLEPSPVVAPPKEVVYCGALSAAATAPYTVESSGDLTVHTRDGFTAFNGFTVKGALSLKSP